MYNLAENEIAKIREQFIAGKIDVQEFEYQLEGWMRWQSMTPYDRREFELTWQSKRAKIPEE